MIIGLSKFNSTAERIAYLVANKNELVDFKKASKKYADAVESNSFTENVVKSLETNFVDDPSTGVIKRTIIGNTYNWMDSHDDVHVENLFSKSINERSNKIWHLHDHVYALTAKVGTFTKIYEKSIAWVDLGINKTGNTMALFLDSNISKTMNEQIFNEYLNGNIDQHSVGMQYVKIDLAVNDSEYKEEFATWNKFIHLLGNRQKAEDKGYFWAVKEAKLIETSAVLEGSNVLTPTVPNISQPDKSTKETKKTLNLIHVVNNFNL